MALGACDPGDENGETLQTTDQTEMGLSTGTGGVTASGGAGPAGTCGNGRLDPGEDCDGTALNGATCTALGFASGTTSCSTICRFDVRACAAMSTPPRISVNASRTSCTAPCAVFFDATGTTGLTGATTRLPGGDYVNATFNWNFSDSQSKHPTGIGFAVAHVFDKAGTYSVSVQARDMSGVSASPFTTTVTVSATSGSTFYVARNGNDANPGTITQPFATVAKGIAKAAPNTSILFRRGDTFSSVTKIGLNLVGPVLFGSYSDPNAPSSTPPTLQFVATETNPVQIDSGSDIRFTDLHFVDTSNRGTVVTIGGNQKATTNVLLERVELEGDVMGAYVGPSSDGVFFVDDHIHKNTQYGMYGAGVLRVAVIGTNIENYGIYHGIRFQGCQETGNTNGACSDGGRKATLEYVAENVIADAGNAYDAVQFRGDNSNIVFVRNNVNRSVGVNPQNNIALEYQSNALIDGNLLYDPRSGNVSQFHAVSITAKHVVVRNNVFVKTAVAVSVLNQPLIPVGWVDEISVYNNVDYYPPGVMSNGNYDDPRFATNSTPGKLSLRNNIFRTDQAASNYGPAKLLDGTGTEDHNLTYAPNNSSFVRPSGSSDLYGDPRWVSLDPANSSAFRLSTGSPAIDKGISGPDFLDMSGNTRPLGAVLDMGAFEFRP